MGHFVGDWWDILSDDPTQDALMSGNVRIIRILRVTRVIRVVRVVKIVRFIRALRSIDSGSPEGMEVSVEKNPNKPMRGNPLGYYPKHPETSQKSYHQNLQAPFKIGKQLV